MAKSPESLAEGVIEALEEFFASGHHRPFQSNQAWLDQRERYREKCVAALLAFGRACAAQNKEPPND